MGNQLAISKKMIKRLVVICIILFIGLFLWNTDFRAILHELQKIGSKFVYLLGITLISYFFGAWSWYVCLGEEKKKTSLFRLFCIRQIGETIAQFNPSSVVAGDILKAKFLQSHGISNITAKNSVAIARATAVLSYLFLLLVAIIWLLWSKTGQQTTGYTRVTFYIIITLILGINGGLFYWLVHKRPIKNITAADNPSFFTKTFNQLRQLIIEIKSFYQQNNPMFWLSYFLATIHWLLGSMEFYLILLFLHVDIQLMHGLLLDTSVLMIKSLGSFIPAQLGAEELANKLMLTLVGIKSISIWVTVSILRRTRQIFWAAIGCLLYFVTQKNTAYA